MPSSEWRHYREIFHVGRRHVYIDLASISDTAAMLSSEWRHYRECFHECLRRVYAHVLAPIFVVSGVDFDGILEALGTILVILGTFLVNWVNPCVIWEAGGSEVAESRDKHGSFPVSRVTLR